MHRCLEVAEILATIIDYVEVLPHIAPLDGGDTPFTEGKHHLLQLAVTCRTFSELALNALWRTQKSLLPLIEILPEDAWDTTITHENNDQIVHRVSITRPLDYPDWHRFDTYAPRIKRLGFLSVEPVERQFDHLSSHCAGPSPPFHYVNPDVFEELAFHRQSRVLLPNLRELRWSIFDIDTMQYAPILYSPALTSFQLGLHRHDPAPVDPAHHDLVYATLASLLEYAPRLRELEMNSVDLPPITDLVQEIAYAIPHLQTFLIHHQTWTHEFISYLSMMPNLRKVGLRANIETDFEFLSSPSHYAPFMSLQVLQLDVENVTSATNLIKLLRRCRLSQISVHVGTTPTSATIRDFLVALQEHCSHSTLHVVRIYPDFEENAVPDGEEYIVNIGTLEPLLSFSELHVFSFCLSMAVDMDNSSLTRMASSWPSLITFWLANVRGFRRRSGITFAGLLSLSLACPDLNLLNIAVDASEIDIDIEHVSTLPRNRCVTSIDVLDSWIGEQETLARGLFAVFPALRYIWGKSTTDYVCESTSMDRFTFFAQVQFRLDEIREANIRQLREFNAKNQLLRSILHAQEFNPW